MSKPAKKMQNVIIPDKLILRKQITSPRFLDVQIGNMMIESVMESKLLDFNLDKSCFTTNGNAKSPGVGT